MRLIDADALMTEFCGECHEDVQDDCRHDPMCGSMMWIAEAPTVEDAVVVVRCKYCSHYDEWTDGGRTYSGCALDDWNHRTQDDFCSSGERKSDNE